jgi:aminopeptidase N
MGWRELLLGFGMLISIIGCMSPRKIAHHYRMKAAQDSVAQIQLKEVRIGGKPTMQYSPTRTMDLLHANIDVSFIWSKHECIGKETLWLKPYFYDTDSIVLDAKSMTINSLLVKDMEGNEIQYHIAYDKQKIRLQLERKLSASDTVTVSISYIAKPDEIQGPEGSAIRENRGLYFINTDHAEPYKPIQLWTQGETECNSGWFPTIDHPSEKFTSSLIIRANKDFTILSNGLKVKTEIEGNTRIEYWENTKPMPAYLIMIAIGEFQVMHDSLKTLPVNYYLEKDYAPLAKRIFAHTPEMIDFFSSKLDVPYPWDKYDQIVVRDFVSGAMENIGATVHSEFVQKNERELVDQRNDDIIAHELFHQWFGDLVTCKSWSHVVLNEGFATYGEQLWQEYKYGAEAGLKKAHRSLERYLEHCKRNADKPIINYTYQNADDMFSSITYQKGARVLHLLRNEMGDIAFFESLKNYLQRYSFQNADIEDLKKEFERTTGRDYTAFFKQWFYQGGHPKLNIRYSFIDSPQMVKVTVEQVQDKELGVFSFPLDFKVRDGNLTKEYRFAIEKKQEVFFVKKFNDQHSGFPVVSVDPYATFIGDITDNKPFMDLLSGYSKTSNYVERLRIIKSLAAMQKESDTARKIMLQGLFDSDEDIRLKTVELVQWDLPSNKSDGYETLLRLSKLDNHASVRAMATAVLANQKDPSLLNHFTELTQDSSYQVAGEALRGIHLLIPAEALRVSHSLALDARGKLLMEISNGYSESKDTAYLGFYMDKIPQFFGRTRFALLEDYTRLIQQVNQPEITSEAISFLEKRAQHDASEVVRYGSILGMHNLAQGLTASIQSNKNAEEKQVLEELQRTITNKYKIIVQLEEDQTVLGMLKMKGIVKDEVVE